MQTIFGHTKLERKERLRLRKMRLRQTLAIKAQAEKRKAYPESKHAIAVIRNGELVGGRILGVPQLRELIY